MIATVLFDLDGTLLDTAPDFAHVLDAMRVERGHPPMDYSAFRSTVSHGASAMLAMAFPDATDDGITLLREEFLERYSWNLYRETRLFPGMDTVIDTLERVGLPWGIVTNKPAWLTEPLLRLAGLDSRIACAVSGDTLPERKPHPAPVRHACGLVGCEPVHALYVGDAERDIQSGRAAGTHTAVALFGYVHPTDRPEGWGADMMVERPEALLDWVEARRSGLRA